ncbi:protein CPR-5 [Eutrema salsugineum]|uniref:protein CPR-5 n=1 Tax=Eutrema salsugineum TaxID=72664 RepID=UPI000CED26F6|nr:protein CPR-5 [Eutrema salsugineum]
MNNDEGSSSSSPSSNPNPNSTRRDSRVPHRLRKHTVRFGMARGSVGKRQAEALALGMYFAASASLVLGRKNATGQNAYADDRALIYASAVKESLASVYGHKLGSFAERSFNTTLRILKVINDSTFPHQVDNLEKSKLKMGVSKAAFRAERFKTKSEDTRKPYMVLDCIVLSVFNILFSTLYGTYVFSQQRIMESTSVCNSISEDISHSWWVPKQVSQINTELNILICSFGVWIQIYFALVMIFVVTYLIIHRSSGTKQTKPVTFTVFFLGYVCGLLGKFCVDTLGGNDKLWLFLWGIFCLLQFFAVVFTSALYGLVYGPVNVTQGTKSSSMVSYWAWRSLFLGVILLVLPLTYGLLPFATFGEIGKIISL